VKILYALLARELCVCDLAKLMEVSQSAVSHQLRVLKNSKLVKFRREGKTVYYSLADEHVVRVLSQGMEHIME
jgi:DNA-binding transcriptional ArsR family regulator